MKRRTFLRSAGAAGAGIAALSLINCGGGSSNNSSSGGSTPSGSSSTGSASSSTSGSGAPLADSQVLRTRFYFDLLPLDPATIFGIEQENTAIAVYNGLTMYDTKTGVAPDLAKGWEQPDGTTYVFHLNPGVKWQSDYGNLTAGDVVWSYNRIIQGKGTYSKDFDLVDSIQAVDDNTVKFLLKKPDLNFIHVVSNYHPGSVLNQKAVEKLGDQHWFNPVGTGPFVLSNFVSGQGYTLTRFNDYFKGKPTLERIDMRTINDQDTTAIALKNNEIDVAMAIRSEPALDKATDPNIKFSIGDKWGANLWMFNMTTKSLGDVRVRQAIASGVDFPSAIKATSPRLSSPADSIVPDWLPEYSADVPKYPFDLKKAKDLLSAAGVSDISVKYMSLGNPNDFLTLVAGSLAKVGIKMEFDIVDRAQFNQRRLTGDFEVTGRGLPAANINTILFSYLHPDYIVPNGFNSAHYNNPELTSKLEAARSELDKEKRLALYADVQRIAMTDLPYLANNVSNEYWGYRTNVEGLAVNRMPEGNWFDLKLVKT